MRQPDGMSGFEFVVVASLRAAQLSRGCIARLDPLGHKFIVTAQREVAAGIVVGSRIVPDQAVVPPLELVAAT
jgi:DNA-directed RNA polymerase subunit K/omega